MWFLGWKSCKNLKNKVGKIAKRSFLDEVQECRDKKTDLSPVNQYISVNPDIST